MKKLNSFESLQELMYTGGLEIKQFPQESFIDYTKLSETQEKMYKHLMVGLSMYTPTELYNMNSAKKSKIFKKHIQTQNVINIWKQELTNKITTNWLSAMLPQNKNIFINTEYTMTNFKNTLTFKELGIKKLDIINKLISEKLLPANFATL